MGARVVCVSCYGVTEGSSRLSFFVGQRKRGGCITNRACKVRVGLLEPFELSDQLEDAGSRRCAGFWYARVHGGLMCLPAVRVVQHFG